MINEIYQARWACLATAYLTQGRHHAKPLHVATYSSNHSIRGQVLCLSHIFSGTHSKCSWLLNASN